MAANNKDVKRGVVIYLDGKEVPNNARAIRAEMKKVSKSIDKMTLGSEEYVRATKKYAQLKGILREHKAQLKGMEAQQESMLSRGTAFFRKYAMEISGVITALTGVTMQLNNFRKLAAEQEDAAANLKALTGLDDDNIAWLTEQAETLSTTMEASGLRVRQSATDILEAYMLVGSAKPELLTDKEALNAVTIEAMRLAEAAKMDLKEAVQAVTTALNQFDAGAEEAVRYVNVLAAGSKFGAANVQDQAAAIKNAGVAASGAGLSIEELVGVIEMLGEKGIKAEEAGTALKGVFLKLQTGADDTNPAVVGLSTALENLAAKRLGAEELLKMFDRRGYNAAKILIENTEKVRQYTEAVTGTNTAVEQAAINSDTAAAKMAQIRNQINLTGQELAKTLAPAFSMTVGWTRKFVLMLPGVIDFLKEYGASTSTLVATLVLYNSYTTIATKVTKAWNAVFTFASTQITGYRAAMVAYREALTGSTTAQVGMTAAVKGTNIVTQAGVVAVGLLKAAYFALSLQTAACARTLKMVKVALAESGDGLAVIAIGAAVAAIMRHNEKMKEAKRLAEEQRQAERELYREYDKAAAKIRALRKAAEDNSAALDERKKAIEELQRLAPGYQASISEEGRLIETNTQKLDEYLERLKASIALEAYKSKTVELLQKQAEAEDDLRAASDKYWKKRQANTLQGWNRNGATAKILRAFGLDDEENAKKAKEKAEKVLKDIEQDIDDTEQRMKELAEKWNFSLVDDKEAQGGSDGEDAGGGSSGGKPEKESERRKRIRKAIADIDAEYDAKANEAKRAYLDGTIATEQEYSQRLQDIELERLQKQLQVAGLEPKQREQIVQKVMDIKVKLMEQIRSMDDLELEGEENKLTKMLRANEDAYTRRNAVIRKALKAGVITQEQYHQRLDASFKKWKADDQEAEEQAATKRLSISRKGLDTALLQLRQARIDEGMTEKEFNAAILNARRAYYEKALEDQRLSKEDREQLERELQDVKLQITEEGNKEIEEKNRQLFDALRSAGEEMGEALAQWITDSETSFKDFSKSILKLALDTVEKMMVAEIAKVTMASIASSVIDWSAVARGAAKIAAITAAFEVAKGAISNFYTGGYTGQGRWDAPRGVVHAGEFVANRYAVANDAVRPVLDLIDQAQRSGSIANLTAEDIAAVAVPAKPSTAAPSRPSAAPPRTGGVHTRADLPPRDPELTRAIQLLTRTTARAAEAYREPSTAFCYLEGRGGIDTARELLEKIKSNASRK